ncbi:MAG: phospho-N-acetylmuramoyl-pentapeptide-transferase [Puniceicoccales bacterium]|jgi:phospho-N-acetylmuramoyl-pentapeptide-transferase|nr:phospho-N-acetylmuramoyl-pentapeptide-transferase [Puniceicoccales bacterium]
MDLGAMVAAFFCAFFSGFLAMGPFIRWTRSRRWEQVLRPKSEVRTLADLHATKEHTPTFGGGVFVVCTTIFSIIFAKHNLLLWTSLGVFLSFAILGFCDDMCKIVQRSSQGFLKRTKFLFQAIICVGVLILISLKAPDYFVRLHELWLPLMRAPLLSSLPTALLFGFLFLVLSGSSNAVNLSDGLDGLATMCSIITAVAFVMIIVFGAGHPTHVPIDTQPLAVVLAALSGALLAFLWYNANPAQIFMGDTGSLAIGGLLGIVAFFILQPFILAIIGGVFVFEALSVILQIYFFKITHGCRIFRMAPLHHHFEIGGWKEPQIVMRFGILSVLCAITGLVLSRIFLI